ncbi:SHOCT domain-containing protein [Aeromicrobium sp. Marseille-Q0843]|uniref:SHOCT domain-containing protein n=1 Tax=Aeromicrobium phoceense TaxID=2754045 RepID=A0A838XFD0_9ACTN|nr:SHOCT domain-containing protein [Aeromicrobium phoceense]MBA4608547.1 SHOCT domain-containing protein [Aeromicrobium phoceense]
MDSFWEFFWWTVSIFLFMGYLIVLFHVIIDLFRDEELSGWWKAIWVFFLILVPALAALVYLIARGGGMARRSAAQLDQARAETDAYIRTVAATSPADQIASAKQLLDSGAISTEEFEALKAKALA